jgi:2-octaprenyl-6-methoxyphenol hydroxylase
MNHDPVVILGAGPVGLTLALLLARRHVPSRVFDARALDAARADPRVLALSRGSLQTVAALAELPRAQLAPIRTVVVSSAGQFGRAVIREDDVGGGQLGATIRYGDLLETLAAAAAIEPLVTIRRPLRIDSVRQRPGEVEIETADGECLTAPLVINAEGLGTRNASALPATSAALVADVEVEGSAAGWAFERFTRDGPLALLPVAARAAPSVQPMALIWCMPVAAADRRHALSDSEFLAEAQAQLGMRNRLRAVRARGRALLAEQSRETLREHRVVYLGNAAQTLHPVAGQGLNLGLRDCVALADCIGNATAAATDPAERLADYERLRRADRAAILALTRTAPALFATRFTPVAIGRSLALTLLSIVPDLRREFARLLMFGVRF